LHTTIPSRRVYEEDVMDTREPRTRLVHLLAGHIQNNTTQIELDHLNRTIFSWPGTVIPRSTWTEYDFHTLRDYFLTKAKLQLRQRHPASNAEFQGDSTLPAADPSDRIRANLMAEILRIRDLYL
jgi:hypothetical protein